MNGLLARMLRLVNDAHGDEITIPRSHGGSHDKTCTDYFYHYGIFAPKLKVLRPLKTYRQDTRRDESEKSCGKPGTTAGGKAIPGVILGFCVDCHACVFANLMLSKESPRTVRNFFFTLKIVLFAADLA